MAWLQRVLGNPSTWVRIHGGLSITWALLIIPSVIWWKDSVPWLVLMSCYANFAGSAASWQSAKADRNSPTCEDVARIEHKVDALRGKINLLVTRGR